MVSDIAQISYKKRLQDFRLQKGAISRRYRIRRNRMNEESKESTSRRAFFHNVTAGTAGIALASALAQLAAPNPAAAQESKTPPAKKPSWDPPPWPKGMTGDKYSHLFSTKLREQTMVPEYVPGPQAYFRGESDLPGAGMNMGWQIMIKPFKMELESHHHDVDEYLIFLGATFPDLVGTFDAEVELFLGKEYEKHTITQATILYIPRGLEHNPLEFKRIGKPLFFSALHLAPYFNGVYQTRGYNEFRSATKM